MMKYAWENLCDLHYELECYERFKLIFLGWTWLLLKLLDLFDTIFFILLRKFKNVSFLHVFHHTTTVLTTWIALQYSPANQNLFMATLNSLIHVVLYYYYLMTSKGYQVSWKKYLTVFQIIQFIVMITFCSYLISCQTNTILLSYTTWQMIQVIIFFALFVNFYVRSYNINRSASITKSHNH
ncbi:hypothetical protein [Trichoplusia ni ascovirus 2c]|uniref:hypothetical protein n=1 Tax=Trichoplusia ni ascovirus 2c TaxID=328615 RepID=UPI0000E44206|nr:hypothetical protein TNAV2c_gp046 [Trichoplusia ni ascovirus 2c]ABF70563.1 hypothetical protein [Trichoplusia ni ascovirus 2c]